ncbi:MAG: transcription termination factor Rho [Lachnospiraceae bacterium]|nr:transcription termination factor Rho [Lachnospiraceae bacterium]
MREKLETLTLQTLKELAKEKGIKGTTSMKKDELIDAIMAVAQSETSKETVNEQTGEKLEAANGILEVLPDGFGFIRCENFLPGENDVYVSPQQIRRFNLKTGDIVKGRKKPKTQNEKFAALLYIDAINGYNPELIAKRKNFEDLTPVFPNERIHMETKESILAMRMVDLISPIGKGQRGMIVAQPKAGKTTLLKQVAKAITTNNKEMHLIILLIDERPEEVTDIKEFIEDKNVEVIYSTFDELPERHKRVSEMVIERAKRLVESGKDVTILLDSITRLARAYNLTVPPSGRTLSGGLDPAALHMPKRFFGAARNMREGGSLTILATALVETGSKMDDVVYEEFKGTGNMELVLDRKLSEKRVFPAIDLAKSGTRREDLLLTKEELEAMDQIRKALNGLKQEEASEKIIEMFVRTRNNEEFIELVKKTRIV